MDDRRLVAFVPVLATIALWASVAEFLLARVATRVTIFIPRGDVATVAVEVLAGVSRWVLAFAFLASVALLGVLAASLVWRRRRWPRAIGSLIILQLALAVGAIAVPGALVTIVFTTGSLALYILLLVPLARSSRLGLVITVGGAYALSSTYTLWTVISQTFGATVPAPDLLVRLAELFAMAATVPIFRMYAWRADVPGALRPTGYPVLVATVLAGLFAFSVTLSLSIVAAVTTFALGFLLFLVPAFVAALWLYLVATVHQFQHRRTRFRGYGLVWLGIAGLQLQLSHQYLLATLALLTLATDGLAGLVPATRIPGPSPPEAVTESSAGDSEEPQTRTSPPRR